MTIERVQSVEQHGDYYRVEVAVNGLRLAPLWMSAPEFRQLESMGEERMWQEIGLRAVTCDETARVHRDRLLNELVTRRYSQ